VSSLGGWFSDVGAGGGAGANYGSSYIGGYNSDGSLITGGSVSAGAGLRGSAAAQATYTNVIPVHQSAGCR
jgi:hypothetical protein